MNNIETPKQQNPEAEAFAGSIKSTCITHKITTLPITSTKQSNQTEKSVKDELQVSLFKIRMIGDLLNTRTRKLAH